MGALVTKQQKDKRFCFVLRHVILGKLIWVVILMMRVQYRRQFFKKYYTYKWLEMALILAPECWKDSGTFITHTMRAVSC